MNDELAVKLLLISMGIGAFLVLYFGYAAFDIGRYLWRKYHGTYVCPVCHDRFEKDDSYSWPTTDGGAKLMCRDCATHLAGV